MVVEAIPFRASKIWVTINDRQLSALVDTGAAISLCDADVYEYVKGPESTLELAEVDTIRGVNGALTAPLGLLRVSMEIGRVRATVAIHVFATAAHSPLGAYDLILGTDALQLLGKVTFDWGNKMMTVQTVDVLAVQQEVDIDIRSSDANPTTHGIEALASQTRLAGLLLNVGLRPRHLQNHGTYSRHHY